MMRAYELMVIFNGGLDENEAHGKIRTVSDLITKAGGSVHGNPTWWGKRQFAYPIDKREFGYYLVLDVLAPGGALDEAERTLRISDDVVRHKLLRLPDSEAARRGMTAVA
ncbi:MAG: 30S ribosomal protein S6 [Ilumatobacteraceae bacterium]